MLSLFNGKMFQVNLRIDLIISTSFFIAVTVNKMVENELNITILSVDYPEIKCVA